MKLYAKCESEPGAFSGERLYRIAGEYEEYDNVAPKDEFLCVDGQWLLAAGFLWRCQDSEAAIVQISDNQYGLIDARIPFSELVLVRVPETHPLIGCVEFVSPAADPIKV